MKLSDELLDWMDKCQRLALYQIGRRQRVPIEAGDLSASERYHVMQRTADALLESLTDEQLRELAAKRQLAVVPISELRRVQQCLVYEERWYDAGKRLEAMTDGAESKV